MEGAVTSRRIAARTFQPAAPPFSYQFFDALTTRTTNSITGTSMSTPTTVASAAPDSNPNRLMAAATASSKKLLAPISADGPVYVGLSDGQTVAGAISTANGQLQIRTQAAGTVSTAMTAVTSLRNQAEQTAHLAAIGAEQSVRQRQTRGADRRLEELGELEVQSRCGGGRSGLGLGGGLGLEQGGSGDRGDGRGQQSGTAGNPRACGVFYAHGRGFFRSRMTIP